MSDNVSMERNFAREVGLFNPPKEVKTAKVKEWVTDMYSAKQVEIDVTYYKEGQQVIYIPTEFVRAFSNLPAARLALAALTTLWLRDREKGTAANEPIRTTLGELCRTVGLTPNGPRRMRMKEALTLLHYVRYRNLTFFDKEVVNRHGKKVKVEGRQELMTILVPELKFFDTVVDGKRQDTTVEVHLCPSLTQALALDVPKARVPVAALQATYGNTQATRAMQNVLFWLSAVTPENPGQPLKPKIDTMIEVMRAEGHRRDKNIQKLKRILNSLQESGVVAWWKLDGDYCLIMKKRDQEILEKKRKKKVLVPGNAQDNQTVVH